MTLASSEAGRYILFHHGNLAKEFGGAGVIAENAVEFVLTGNRRGLPLSAVLIAGAVMMGATSAAYAADLRDVEIAQLDAVALGISQITPEGLQCGLEPARLLEVARQGFSGAGIVLRDDAASRITLSVITTREGAGDAERCASAVMLGAYRRESYFSAETGWLQNGFVVLWQRSLLQLTPASTHAASVAGSVRRITVQMLADRETQRRDAAGAKTAEVLAATGSALRGAPGGAKSP
jgi:hypothetical protein